MNNTLIALQLIVTVKNHPNNITYTVITVNILIIAKILIIAVTIPLDNNTHLIIAIHIPPDYITYLIITGNIPPQPDWLFKRPSLTLDFIVGVDEPSDQVYLLFVI